MSDPPVMQSDPDEVPPDICAAIGAATRVALV